MKGWMTKRHSVINKVLDVNGWLVCTVYSSTVYTVVQCNVHYSSDWVTSRNLKTCSKKSRPLLYARGIFKIFLEYLRSSVKLDQTPSPHRFFLRMRRSCCQHIYNELVILDVVATMLLQIIKITSDEASMERQNLVTGRFLWSATPSLPFFGSPE